MKNLAFRSCDRFTQEEFASWLEELPPNDLHHYELLDGFILREPPAGWPHGEIAVKIILRLGPFVEREQLGRVFDSSQGFDLPTGDTLEPDVSFVSTERWRASQPVRGKFLRVIPDLVFAVLAQSTEKIDRGDKKRIYARNGVREYVMVDERSRTFHRFTSRGQHFDRGHSLDEDESYESSVLPGLAFRVGDVFPES